jgi:hypothetical protein
MSIYLGSQPINKIIFVPPPPITLSGLIGWYDAADYTSGATWVDKSVNGLNLTLSGTFSKTGSIVAGEGPALLFNTAVGLSSTSTLITGSVGEEYTTIQIFRPTVVGNFKAIVSLINNTGGDQLLSLGSFQLDGTGRIYTWVNGQTGFWLDTGPVYDTAKTSFVARRAAYGFNDTSGLTVSYGDDSSASLTHYGAGSFTLGRGPYPASFNTNYDLGSAGRILIGAANTAGGFAQEGFYAVNLFYDRALTDEEIQTIYNFYKPTYNLV